MQSIFFFTLVLYLVTFSDPLISSSGCFVNSLGFSSYRIMSFCKNNFICCFPIWVCFISLCYLIVLARISGTIVGRNVGRGHPCLALDFRRKHSIFPMLFNAEKTMYWLRTSLLTKGVSGLGKSIRKRFPRWVGRKSSPRSGSLWVCHDFLKLDGLRTFWRGWTQDHQCYVRLHCASITR